MATGRAARKRGRVKTSSRLLELALASHQSDVHESGGDNINATLASAELTFVRNPIALLYSLLTPPQTDPPNKATSTFAVTELLEEVLLLLPRKDILLCQRVNRTFKDTVVGSIKLQRFLFLEPEKGVGVVALMTRTPSAELEVSGYIQRDNSETQDEETYCQPVVPNPLLFYNADLHNRGICLELGSTSGADLLAHSALPFHNSDLLGGLFSGVLSQSACLEMFLTQPPLCEVSVELNIRECTDCHRTETCCFGLPNVKNSKGLIVRDIFAAARAFHYSHPALPGEEEQDEVTSISIGFEAVVPGSKNGVLLLTAEDMRLAKLEASQPRLEKIVKAVQT